MMLPGSSSPSASHDGGDNPMTEVDKPFPVARIQILQWSYVASYAINFLLFTVMIRCMQRSRGGTSRTKDISKVILPAFMPLLVILAGVTGAFTVFLAFAMATHLYKEAIPLVAGEAFYAASQFKFTIIVIVMLHHSVSRSSLRRSVVITFGLSTYTLPVAWYLAYHKHAGDIHIVRMLTRTPILLLFVGVLLRPPNARATRKTLREFCAYVCAKYLLDLLGSEALERQEVSLSFVISLIKFVWGALCPLLIWRVLKADTEQWRRLGQRACGLQRLYCQNSRVLSECTASNGTTIRIELRRSFIIDFAQLNVKTRISHGMTSVVFDGVVRSTLPVAVKLYTPAALNEDTVSKFSHEAALCASLRHPNIVKFYGLCIFPPSICLVSELCTGTLDSALTLMAHQQVQQCTRQDLIDIAFMLDAARAVAYLHSFSPPFLHRDINPANFQIDSEGNVKLTNLGASRTVSARSFHRDMHHIVGPSGQIVHHSGASFFRHASPRHGGNVKIVRTTTECMAPELINGRAGRGLFGKASDVYALAITMWDILHPDCEKFSSLKLDRATIFKAIIEGKRPPVGQHVHPSLRSVLETAWHSDARLRPCAQEIVHTLEIVQEELLASFSLEMEQVMDTLPQVKMPVSSTDRSFSGSQAVLFMAHFGHVASIDQGVRIGNALMDAGFLHHVHHSVGFRNSDAEFYFDTEHRLLNSLTPRFAATAQSVAACLHPNYSHESSNANEDRVQDRGLETWLFIDQNLSSLPMPHHFVPVGMCACRSLGQGVNGSRRRRSRRRRLRQATTCV